MVASAAAAFAAAAAAAATAPISVCGWVALYLYVALNRCGSYQTM